VSRAMSVDDCYQHGSGPIGCREPEVASRDRDARGEPRDIPLDRTGQRLVVVVEPEDERALRGLEETEVQKMGVTAQLSLGEAPGRTPAVS
jgi:hypothetical protein